MSPPLLQELEVEWPWILPADSAAGIFEAQYLPQRWPEPPTPSLKTEQNELGNVGFRAEVVFLGIFWDTVDIEPP